MAKQFSPIAAFDDSPTEWAILGRVSRIWLAVRPGSRSDEANLECMIIDQQESLPLNFKCIIAYLY